MPNHQRVLDLLVKGKDEAVAITGTERQPLTYSDLQRQIEKTISQLNQLGVGRNDPVAIVLPNGPEMATAFVAIASGATTAPLNPAYREEEFDFYLSDLNTRLLVVEEGSQTSNPFICPTSGSSMRFGSAAILSNPRTKRHGSLTMSPYPHQQLILREAFRPEPRPDRPLSL